MKSPETIEQMTRATFAAIRRALFVGPDPGVLRSVSKRWLCATVSRPALFWALLPQMLITHIRWERKSS